MKRRRLLVVFVLIGLALALQLAFADDRFDVATAPASPEEWELPTPPSTVTSTTATTGPSTTTTTARSAAPVPVHVYAVRLRDGKVAVLQRPLGEGPAEELFRYTDGRTASDDPTEPVWVDVALSPDGRQVAYGVRSALYVRDLATGKVRTVVSSKPRAASPESGKFWPDGPPPQWSIPAMTEGAVFGIGSPLVWSPDGRSIAFDQIGYEWTDFGVVDLASGRYDSSFGGHDIAWLPSGDRVVIAGDGYADPGRVQVSQPGRLSVFTDITDRVSEPPVRDYQDVTVSPSGRRLAVRYEESPYTAQRRPGIAILGVDGSSFRALAVRGAPLVAAFTPDEAALLVVERRGERSAVLVRHPLDGTAPAELRALPEDLPGWRQMEFTATGEIAMIGTNSPAPGVSATDPETGGPLGYLSRFLLLDAHTGATQYESGNFDRFTSLLARVALRPYAPPSTPPTTAPTTTTTIHACIPYEDFGAFVWDLEFADQNRGWAAGTGALRITTDGGRTWTSACLPSHDSPHVLSRVGEYGWGPGNVRTTDGGVHWTVTRPPLPDAKSIDLTFVDAQRGWLVADGPAPRGSTVLRTDDAGTHWQIMDQWPSGTVITVRRVTFVDRDHGWVLGTTTTGPVVAATTDGGTNWLVHPLPAGLDVPIDFTFVDEDRGWVLATDAPANRDPHAVYSYANVLLATTDGGATFVEQGRFNQLWELDFVDAAHGFIIGTERDAGTVLYSTDNGGATWTPSPAPGRAMTKIDFVDPTHGWIAGQNGSCIYRTTDAGRSWQGTALDPRQEQRC